MTSLLEVIDRLYEAILDDSPVIELLQKVPYRILNTPYGHLRHPSFKSSQYDPNKPFFGLTLLMWAAANGHTAAVRYLLSQQVDIDVKETNTWRTALAFACSFSSPTLCTVEIVQALLDANADPNTRDIENLTPLIYILRGNDMYDLFHVQLVDMLLSAGALTVLDDLPLHLFPTVKVDIDKRVNYKCLLCTSSVLQMTSSNAPSPHQHQHQHQHQPPPLPATAKSPVLLDTTQQELVLHSDAYSDHLADDGEDPDYLQLYTTLQPQVQQQELRHCEHLSRPKLRLNNVSVVVFLFTNHKQVFSNRYLQVYELISLASSTGTDVSSESIIPHCNDPSVVGYMQCPVSYLFLHPTPSFDLLQALYDKNVDLSIDTDQDETNLMLLALHADPVTEDTLKIATFLIETVGIDPLRISTYGKTAFGLLLSYNSRQLFTDVYRQFADYLSSFEECSRFQAILEQKQQVKADKKTAKKAKKEQQQVSLPTSPASGASGHHPAMASPSLSVPSSSSGALGLHSPPSQIGSPDVPANTSFMEYTHARIALDTQGTHPLQRHPSSQDLQTMSLIRHQHQRRKSLASIPDQKDRLAIMTNNSGASNHLGTDPSKVISPTAAHGADLSQSTSPISVVIYPQSPEPTPISGVAASSSSPHLLRTPSTGSSSSINLLRRKSGGLVLSPQLSHNPSVTGASVPPPNTTIDGIPIAPLAASTQIPSTNPHHNRPTEFPPSSFYYSLLSAPEQVGLLEYMMFSKGYVLDPREEKRSVYEQWKVIYKGMKKRSMLSKMKMKLTIHPHRFTHEISNATLLDIICVYTFQLHTINNYSVYLYLLDLAAKRKIAVGSIVYPYALPNANLIPQSLSFGSSQGFLPAGGSIPTLPSMPSLATKPSSPGLVPPTATTSKLGSPHQISPHNGMHPGTTTFTFLPLLLIFLIHGNFDGEYCDETFHALCQHTNFQLQSLSSFQSLRFLLLIVKHNSYHLPTSFGVGLFSKLLGNIDKPMEPHECSTIIHALTRPTFYQRWRYQLLLFEKFIAFCSRHHYALFQYHSNRNVTFSSLFSHVNPALYIHKQQSVDFISTNLDISLPPASSRLCINLIQLFDNYHDEYALHVHSILLCLTEYLPSVYLYAHSPSQTHQAMASSSHLHSTAPHTPTSSQHNSVSDMATTQNDSINLRSTQGSSSLVNPPSSPLAHPQRHSQTYNQSRLISVGPNHPSQPPHLTATTTPSLFRTSSSSSAASAFSMAPTMLPGSPLIAYEALSELFTPSLKNSRHLPLSSFTSSTLLYHLVMVSNHHLMGDSFLQLFDYTSQIFTYEHKILFATHEDTQILIEQQHQQFHQHHYASGDDTTSHDRSSASHIVTSHNRQPKVYPPGSVEDIAFHNILNELCILLQVFIIKCRRFGHPEYQIITRFVHFIFEFAQYCHPSTLSHQRHRQHKLHRLNRHTLNRTTTTAAVSGKDQTPGAGVAHKPPSPVLGKQQSSHVPQSDAALLYDLDTPLLSTNINGPIPVLYATVLHRYCDPQHLGITVNHLLYNSSSMLTPFHSFTVQFLLNCSSRNLYHHFPQVRSQLNSSQRELPNDPESNGLIVYRGGHTIHLTNLTPDHDYLPASTTNLGSDAHSGTTNGSAVYPVITHHLLYGLSPNAKSTSNTLATTPLVRPDSALSAEDDHPEDKRLFPHHIFQPIQPPQIPPRFRHVTCHDELQPQLLMILPAIPPVPPLPPPPPPPSFGDNNSSNDLTSGGNSGGDDNSSAHGNTLRTSSRTSGSLLGRDELHPRAYSPSPMQESRPSSSSSSSTTPRTSVTGSSTSPGIESSAALSTTSSAISLFNTHKQRSPLYNTRAIPQNAVQSSSSKYHMYQYDAALHDEFDNDDLDLYSASLTPYKSSATLAAAASLASRNNEYFPTHQPTGLHPSLSRDSLNNGIDDDDDDMGRGFLFSSQYNPAGFPPSRSSLSQSTRLSVSPSHSSLPPSQSHLSQASHPPSHGQPPPIPPPIPRGIPPVIAGAPVLGEDEINTIQLHRLSLSQANSSTSRADHLPHNGNTVMRGPSHSHYHSPTIVLQRAMSSKHHPATDVIHNTQKNGGDLSHAFPPPDLSLSLPYFSCAVTGVAHVKASSDLNPLYFLSLNHTQYTLSTVDMVEFLLHVHSLNPTSSPPRGMGSLTPFGSFLLQENGLQQYTVNFYHIMSLLIRYGANMCAVQPQLAAFLPGLFSPRFASNRYAKLILLKLLSTGWCDTIFIPSDPNSNTCIASQEAGHMQPKATASFAVYHHIYEPTLDGTTITQPGLCYNQSALHFAIIQEVTSKSDATVDVDMLRDAHSLQKLIRQPQYYSHIMFNIFVFYQSFHLPPNNRFFSIPHAFTCHPDEEIRKLLCNTAKQPQPDTPQSPTSHEHNSSTSKTVVSPALTTHQCKAFSLVEFILYRFVPTDPKDLATPKRHMQAAIKAFVHNFERADRLHRERYGDGTCAAMSTSTGMDLSLAGSSGQSLLWYLMNNCTPTSADIMTLFHDCNIDPSAHPFLSNGQTLFMHAILRRWDNDSLRILIDCFGASHALHHHDDHGRSALHYAWLTGCQLYASEFVTRLHTAATSTQ